jgi:hypothetical protein
VSYIKKLEDWLQAQKDAGNPVRFDGMRKDDERPLREILEALFAPEFLPGSGVVGEGLRARYTTDPEGALDRLAEIFLKIMNGEIESREMTPEELKAL